MQSNPLSTLKGEVSSSFKNREIPDMTHLEPIDLREATLPSSGRSGNMVLLTQKYVYKLFNVKNPDEYNLEVVSAFSLYDFNLRLVFDKALDRRQVILPDKSKAVFNVIRLHRIYGITFVPVKQGVSHFINFLKLHIWDDVIQLKNHRLWFSQARDAGLSDPQFIYEVETTTPYFMDLHLKRGGSGSICDDIVSDIESRLEEVS